MIKPADIKTALTNHFCQARDTNDVEMEDMEITTPSSQHVDNNNMFKHNSTGHPIQKLFSNMIEHNRTTTPLSFEEDENILTVLGLLTSHDIKFLNRPTIDIFMTAIHRSNGEDHTPENISSLKLSYCHQTLFDEQHSILYMTVARKTKALDFENLTLHSVRPLRRSQLQLLLYQKYQSSSNPFSFPFIHIVDAMRKELTSIIHQRNSPINNPPDDDNKLSTNHADTSPVIPAVTQSQPEQENANESDPTKNQQQLTDNSFPLSFDPFTCTTITAGLSNADIDKIPESQARILLKTYAESKGTKVADTFHDKLSSKQLISQIRSARDLLSKQAANTGIKKVVNTSIPSAQTLAENLRGVDSTTMDPSTTAFSTDNRAPSKQLEDTESEKQPSDTITNVREETYIHVEYESSEKSINVHSAIKSFMLQLRKADPNIQVLPYDEDTYLPSDIITNEKDFPAEEQKLGK